MEIEYLLRQKLQKNKTIQQLARELQNQKKICLQNALVLKMSTQQCDNKQIQYKNYLSLYSQQFQQNGYQLCKQLMENSDDLRASYHECLSFYMKNSIVFEANVIDKLHHLIGKKII